MNGASDFFGDVLNITREGLEGAISLELLKRRARIESELPFAGGTPAAYVGPDGRPLPAGVPSRPTIAQRVAEITPGQWAVIGAIALAVVVIVAKKG